MTQAEHGTARDGYLFVLPWFPGSGIGGVNQAVLNLIRVMSERGDARPLLLISSDCDVPAAAPHIACPVISCYLRAPDLPPTALLRATLGFLVHVPAALWALWRLVSTRNIRTVSCAFPDTECVHFVLLRQLGLFQGRVVLWFHGNEIVTMRQKGRLGRWWTKWMLRHADRVVACSQGLLEDILRFEPRCAPRSAVIYNAIDIEAFQDTAEWTCQIPEQLRARPFLLNIARFEYKKGHDVLIRAFERVASHTADLQLVMIGGALGDESAAVRQLAEASPCRDRILMLENMPHQRVPIFLRAALLFVLASRREGFPFVLLEAGAFRKPVVATSCIGVPELIEDGVTGRLAPVDDDVALAQSIEDLLEDEVKRNGLAENLHRRVQEEFNWPVVVKQHLAL